MLSKAYTLYIVFLPSKPCISTVCAGADGAAAVAHIFQPVPSLYSRNDMELPRTPVLPPWTNYSYPSLTTRPLLTVHRSRYVDVPRLFPADLEPHRIARPPVCVTGEHKSTNVGPLCAIESDFNSLSFSTGTKIEQCSSLARPMGSRSYSGHMSVLPSYAVDSISRAQISASRIQTVASPLAIASTSRARGLPPPYERNTATAVTAGEDFFATFAVGGSLRHVALYRATGESSLRVVPHSLPSGRAVAASAHLTAAQVTCIAARDADGICAEPARLAFGTHTSLQLGTLEHGLDICWGADIPITGALYSAAFSSTCRDELLTLCQEGVLVRVLDAGGLPIRISTRSSVWREKVESHYFRTHYAAHPRVALLASQGGLHRADMRGGTSPVGTTHAMAMFNIWRDWSVSPSDGGLRVFERHPSKPFWSIVASDHLLAVVDERMSCYPVLTWSLTSSPLTRTTLSCVQSVRPGNHEYGEVIALGSPSDGSLSLFHLHSDKQAEVGSLSPNLVTPSLAASIAKSSRAEPRSLSTAGGTSSASSGPVGTRPSAAVARKAIAKSLSGFPVPSALWSDLPLTQLPSYAPTERLAGIAFLPHPRSSIFTHHDTDKSLQAGACLSLLQVSQRGGAISQLIGCNSFEDGDYLFELRSRRMDCGQSGENAMNECNLSEQSDQMDSVIAVREAQLAFSSSATKERILNRVNDGVRVFQATKRLPAVGGVDLRRRLLSSIDDEEGSIGVGGVVPRAIHVIARPELSDRPIVARIHSEIEGEIDAIAGPNARPVAGVSGCSSSPVLFCPSASTDLDSRFIEEFLGVPRTAAEIIAAMRVGDPHASLLSRAPVADALEHSTGVESYFVTSIRGSNPELPAKVYTTWHGLSDRANGPSVVLDASPFAQQLVELEDLFFKRDHGR